MTAATATAAPDPKRWQALAIVCVAFFMTMLDVSIVNVALPSIGDSPPLLGDRPAVGDHGLRDHLRRLPAAGRARGGPPRPQADVPRRRADLLDRLARLRPRGLDRRAHRGARRAGFRRGDHVAVDALDRHDDLRGGRRAEQGARHLGRDRRQRRRGRRPARRHPRRSTSAGSGSSSSTSRWARSCSPSTPGIVRESRAPDVGRNFDASAQRR